MSYTVHQAKTNLSRLIKEAEKGAEVIITRGKKPVAKLVPITPKARRVFGALKGKLSIGPEFFEPLPPEELDTWDQGPPGC